MKSYLLPVTMAVFVSLVLTSCIKEKFDEPPVNIPHVDFQANKTIAELKAMYSGGLDSIQDTIIIKGIVISSDEEGNIYKSLYIQDHTAGILIALDRTNLYTTFKPGQRVFVKCKGLYLGNYGGVTQLGYIYNNAIGRIPNAMIDNHIFRDSLPGPVPTPLSREITTITGNDICRLIRIDNVFFEETGVEFAPQSASATDRKLIDMNGNSIILRTSKYASFASSKTPKGRGSVIAILSSYNGTYQLYINSLKNLVNWDTTAQVPNNIIYETFTTAPSNWVTYSVSSNKNWVHDATYQCMSVNGYGGDAPSHDWLISPAINLTNTNSPVLTFRTWTRYTDNGTTKPLTVWISEDYPGTGNPTQANWTEITNVTLSPTNSQSWTNSGDIDLSAYIGKTIRIGFKYVSSGTGSNAASHWEVDEFKVKALSK
ncbi:MAG: DUF5689 domain-containing protein [Bacteroidales bacterium]|nr:DUF5689 domain-containing protein [Bacteroidales bacterium]